MSWEERIERRPEVLAGKPVVKGTRLSVELILELLGGGWSEDDLLKSYPRLTIEDIRACLQYASAMLQAERA
jgi:uncharacterized protein (DUF433 family)